MIHEKIKKMIHEVVRNGGTPRTILLTPEDAKAMNIPTWTRQLFGMKCVVAANLNESKVVSDFYETVQMRTKDLSDAEIRDRAEHFAQKKVILQ